MDDSDVLARDIQREVGAVLGVSAVFRAGSSVRRVIDAGARTLGLRKDDSPLVVVAKEGDGVRIEVSIGVRASARAPEVAQLAHDTAARVATKAGMTDAVVRLTVAHVDDSPPIDLIG